MLWGVLPLLAALQINPLIPPPSQSSLTLSLRRWRPRSLRPAVKAQVVLYPSVAVSIYGIFTWPLSIRHSFADCLLSTAEGISCLVGCETEIYLSLSEEVVVLEENFPCNRTAIFLQ